MRRAAGAAALLGLAVTVAVAAACTSINNHLLEGQQYYAPGACLSPQEVVDDLPGADPGGSCAPECLVVPPQGGSPQTVYITTTCPPYPGYPTSELKGAAKDAADPCVGAFAAYAEGGICTSYEGGIEAAVDSGAKVDATAEAAGDAGTGG